MAITKHHPSVSSLISKEWIPAEFSSVGESIDDLFLRLRYRNLVVERSSDNVTAFFGLTLITREFAVDLLGSGVKLILCPGVDANTPESEFGVTFEYRWAILRYLPEFQTLSFAGTGRAFFDIFLELVDIDQVQFLTGIVECFIDDPAPYQALVDQLKGANSALASLDLLNQPFGYSEIEYIVNQIEAANVDVFEAAFEAIVEDLNDIDESFDRLVILFQRWFGSISGDDLKALLIPQASASIGPLSVGIQFPAKVLREVDANGNPIPDPQHPGEDKPARLTFDVGTLRYATSTGFDFENTSAFSFPRSEIGKTGVLVEFSGLKLDLRTDRNIPEADADGRGVNFRGVYAASASVTLPAKWFKDADKTNAEVYGEKLLIGTGGISGKLSLTAKGGDNTLWVKLGSSSGFALGFRSFDIEFKQNKVLSSNISGAMKIAKFVYPTGHMKAGTPVEIGITGHIDDEGDFSLTASANPAYPIELPDVFVYHARSIELGREGDEFFIGTSGKLEFLGFLKDTLKLAAIDIEKFRIYSDGTFEFQGGSISLIEPIVLPIGPVEITVTAIHLGSHQKEVGGVMRKFSYFGFDGGISVDPLGVEVRGDGVKFYFCTDDLGNKPDPYLHIQTLYVDLTIPASSPAVILNGWLSIPEPGTSPEYAGGIKLQVPSAKISGSVDMKLMPRYPAFIVDASIELPTPIPWGPVAVYGFRGLIGYRYVAEKEAVGLVSGVDTWYDYYTHSPRGIHVTKFNGPNRTKASGTPFSLGAGISVGTTDNGFAVNIKAMALLSIPSMFMIDGRAAVISARLGLEDAKEPPFFAFIAIGDGSLEFGFGADFKMPTASGDIINLYAEVQAAFFFNDASKWYVNFGTKEKPMLATIIRILRAQSYLMINARGIEAGARCELSFNRAYGPIKVSAWAYIELGGKISFERPQFGAYMAAGVGADIKIKVVDLYAAFDILFGVEGAKPFKIYGEFNYCVSIKIAWVFKFSYCGNLAVAWEFNSSVDRSPVNPMLTATSETKIDSLVKGVSMLSNETFALAPISGSFPPTGVPADVLTKIIPLDTYIDFNSEKGFIPNAVSAIIGGVTNPAERYSDLIPPDNNVRGQAIRQVTHEYSVVSFEILAFAPGTGWVPYNPWKALYPNDPSLDNLRAGQFQKADGKYNAIRVLGTSPFSYTEQGMPGWFIPEQYGLTPGRLFCQSQQRKPRCANFLEKPLGHRYECPDNNNLFYSNQVAFLLMDHRSGEYAEVVSASNVFGFAQSLKIRNSHRLQIRLPQPSIAAELRLSTHAPAVQVKYFASIQDDDAMVVGHGNPDQAAADPLLPHIVTLTRAELDQPVIYDRPDWLPITRIEVEPVTYNGAKITAMESQIATIRHDNNLIALQLKPGTPQKLDGIEKELETRKVEDCSAWRSNTSPKPTNFVNQYEKLRLTMLAAATFLEKDGAFAYSVGATEKGPAIIKTTPDGETVWCRQLGLDAANLQFHEIIQVVDRKEVTYVICAFGSGRFYLVCIDPHGNERWCREVLTRDAAPHCCLLPIVDQDGLYFVYSDRRGPNGQMRTVLLEVGGDGGVRLSRRLDLPNLQQDFVAMTADSHEKGLTIAGQVGISDRGGPQPPDRKRDAACIVVELDRNLQIIRSWLYRETTVHDLLAFAVGKFVFSCQCSNVHGIALIQVGISKVDAAYEVPESNDMKSVLCAVGDEIYLSAYNQVAGNVFRIDFSFRSHWTKATRLGKNGLGLNSLSYNARTNRIAFTTRKVNLFGIVNPDFGTCIASERSILQLHPFGVRAGQPEVRVIDHDPTVKSVNGHWTDLNPHPVNVCAPDKPVAEDCGTTIHQVCWLSLEDYRHNLIIPGQDAIQEDTEATIAGLTGSIQPIWRPETSYAIRIELQDLVDNGTSTQFAYAFGFTTSGPVGYSEMFSEAHPLGSLRQYIDYARSYPNADGNLLSAKPLFYDSEFTKIDLFLQKAWARYFFYEWPAYNGLPPLNGHMKIVIKDPAEGTEINNPPALGDPLFSKVPQADESWEDDLDPVVPPICQQYQNLLESQQCVLYGGETIRPKAEYMQATPKHLKPQKLYTAIVNNLYDMNRDGVFDSVEDTREVHKFVFQTSRYKDFAEQINSYLLKDDKGAIRPAVFSVKKGFTVAEVAAALATITDTPDILADSLSSTIQHPFDRVIEGIFALSPLPPAQTTEFNLLRNENAGDAIVAVLIRNPEPFNNPRMPLDQVLDTIAILDGGGELLPDYRVLFSKDYSQALVMHRSLQIIGPWQVRFQYKLWNGSGYAVPGAAGTVVIDDLDISSF